MLLTVIVPTHNRAEILSRTLYGLSLQRLSAEWELIVVNSNCTDNTDAVVEAYKKKFPVPIQLIHECKPGAAAARNAGAWKAKGKYLVFVDNDILTEPDFLQLHLSMLQLYPDAWVVGQVVNLPIQEQSVFGSFRKSLFPLINSMEKARTVSGLSAQNVSLPRGQFFDLGGFDEGFSVASSEDHELAMRAQEKLGIRILLIPSIVVVHDDWAGWNFSDFCLRQSLYAQSEFFFWQKYGERHPRLKLVQENLPVNWNEDPLHLILRKKVKAFLSYRLVHSFLIRLCRAVEKLLPARLILWPLYKAALIGAIHQGFRVGMSRFHLGKEESLPIA